VLAESRFATRAKARDGLGITDVGKASSRFVNRHMGHVRYAVSVLEWLAGETFAQLETNEFVLLRMRLLFGGGPRLAFFQNDQFAGHVGTAYMAEYEQLDSQSFVSQPTSSDRTNWWHRWSSYLSLRLLVREGLSMGCTTYVQPRFDALSDVRVIHDAALEVALSEWLGLELGMAIRHDSKPPVYCAVSVADAPCATGDTLELEATDVRLENALSFRF
jgi:hypothetical protein